MSAPNGSTNTAPTADPFQQRRERLRKEREEEERLRRQHEEEGKRRRRKLAEEEAAIEEEEHLERLKNQRLEKEREKEKRAKEEREKREKREKEKREREEKEKREKEKREREEREKREREKREREKKDKGKAKQVVKSSPVAEDSDSEVQLVEKPGPSKERGHLESQVSALFVGKTPPRDMSTAGVKKPPKKKVKMGGMNVCGNCRNDGVACEEVNGGKGTSCLRCVIRKMRCGAEVDRNATSAGIGGEGEPYVAELLEKLLEEAKRNNALMQGVLRECMLTSVSVGQMKALMDMDFKQRQEREVNGSGEGIWMDDGGDVYKYEEQSDVSTESGLAEDAGVQDVIEKGYVDHMEVTELADTAVDQRAHGVRAEDFGGALAARFWKGPGTQSIKAETALKGTRERNEAETKHVGLGIGERGSEIVKNLKGELAELEVGNKGEMEGIGGDGRDNGDYGDDGDDGDGGEVEEDGMGGEAALMQVDLN